MTIIHYNRFSPLDLDEIILIQHTKMAGYVISCNNSVLVLVIYYSIPILCGVLSRKNCPPEKFYPRTKIFQ